MKVAEIFADLGFKIEGADELKTFDTLLKSVAASAQAAVAALRQLSGITIPRARTAAAASAAATPGGATTAAVAAGAAALPAGTPPPAARNNTAVNQGLKSLTTFPKVLKQLLGVGSVIYLMKSLIGGFKNMIQSSVKASFGLDKFTRQTGMTLEDMKRWERVAAANDVKADEVFENLKALQQNAVNISLGNGGTNANRWGIDPLKAGTDPEAVFKDFQEVTRNVSQAQAMAVAEAAGITERVAQMLLRERDHPTQVTSGLAQTTEELKVVRELGSAWNTLRVVMSSLADKITADVAPAFTSVVKFLTELATALTVFDGLRGFYKNMMLTPTGVPGGAIPFVKNSGYSQTNHVNVAPTITINGVTDPAAAGRAAAKYIDRSFSDALYGRPQPFVMRPSPAP